MTVNNKFKEYVWLVNTIKKARNISFEEIQRLWIGTEMSGGVELSRSTFNRHKDAIQDIFGLNIDCDTRNGYKYYISNERVLREDTIQNWMLSTISVNNIVSESVSIQDRIMLDYVPCDEHLEIVIEAMKKNVNITITYQRYNTDTCKELTFEPYCTKLFGQRWYVLGHFHKAANEKHEELDYYGIFAFDRIKEMHLTDIKFKMKEDFNAKEYFNECWGIVACDDTPLERVIIRAYGEERFYMRDLPLHHSQRSIKRTKNYEDFELRLRPTCDFCDHLLSKGNRLKVLSPEWLIDEIRAMLEQTWDRYENED